MQSPADKKTVTPPPTSTKPSKRDKTAMSTDAAVIGGVGDASQEHWPQGYVQIAPSTDRLRPVEIDDVVLPLKRAPRRAKTVRTWKRAKALSDPSDSDSDSEEVSDGSDDIDPIISDNSSPERSDTAPPAPLC
ncbi:Hypothetical predicted protein [Pelobates cultripes]|uniref:Uncharacterized protein n=1 Tax=Pelobates cultripes TaxID=61616 RepID=A0AAD1WJX3_PELCU|nr:Hypothetical predicted protein [Pelobates cultripes]